MGIDNAALLKMMRAQFSRKAETAAVESQPDPIPSQPRTVGATLDFNKLLANTRKALGMPKVQVELWHHPESDTYFHRLPGSTVDSEDIAEGLVDDVTNQPDHWAAYWAQEQDRLTVPASDDAAQAESSNSLPAVTPPVPALREEIEDVEWTEYDDTHELADAVAEYQDALKSSGRFDSEHVDAVLQRATNILEGVNFELDDSQRAAVVGMVKSGRACLMGAAGTGKSTCIRFVLNGLINGMPSEGIDPLRLEAVDIAAYSAAAREAKQAVEAIDPDGEPIDIDEEEIAKSKKVIVPAIALVAFTGQAVQVLKKNLPPNWRRNAMTIHSLLGYAPESYVNEKGEEKWRFAPTYTRWNRMPWDVIVIDEASMVNVELYHEVLNAAKNSCRIYFVGDLNQLTPAIGQGIFGFALAKLPVFELTTIHRQADEAANKIVDTAWSILKGKFNPETDLDNPRENPNWRVIGMKLDSDSGKAHQQIAAIAKGLSTQKVSASVNPHRPSVYDPWRDRILTPMNGYNEESVGALLGQFPLNETLSQVFAGGQERIIIDFKKGTKRFGIGYRVMATKNEPANTLDRVTNGLTGVITEIVPNPDWLGDWRLVGPESKVKENRATMVKEALAMGNDTGAQMAYELQESLKALDDVDFTSVEGLLDQAPEERQSGPSSHIVTVKFDNGGMRVYNLNAEVEQLQIAYASTVHKAQGAEMPTVIIVVHHLQKRMLFRESLYTAVTRAKERVVFLYTDYAFRIAQANQKISGSTLQQKIEQYLRLMGESETVPGFKLVNVRLTSEENEAFYNRDRGFL